MLNLSIGSNYLYVSGPSQGASVIDVQPPFPFNLLFFEAIAVVVFVALWWGFRQRLSARGWPRTGSPRSARS